MNLILERFNLGGFRLINNLAGYNVWLDRFMIFAADMMGYFLLVSMVIIFWKKNYFKKAIVVSFGSAIIARFGFVSLMRYFFYSPRPFLVLDNINQLMNHESESSFPSGHAAFYFALMMGICFYNKKAGWIYFVLAGLMGFARVFVGVHWPLDILAGAVLGIITSLAINYLKQKMPRWAFLN